MNKAALLIGVSEYGESSGLKLLPSAAEDIKAMQRVLLRSSEFSNEQIRVLPNPQKIDVEEAIYWLFANRKKDDLLLFYFSGHGIRDQAGKLYFSLPSTRKDQRGELMDYTAVPATVLHEKMNQSQSNCQVLVLDCCFSGAVAKGLTIKDDGRVDIPRQLGGKGRAIFTSSNSIEYSFQQEGLTLSVYTHFFVEGLEKGAADLDGDGLISADELHTYVSDKVKTAAPAMTPQFFPVEQGHKIYLGQSPKDDLQLKYRKAVQQRVLQRSFQVARERFSIPARKSLDLLRDQLGLSEEVAATIEIEVLQPLREYQRKLQEYEQTLKDTLKDEGYPLSLITQDDLKNYQTLLGLKDEDIRYIESRFLPASEPDLKTVIAPELTAPDLIPLEDDLSSERVEANCISLKPIEIHEFSTGIIPERTTNGGWVSCGFTGQYMNSTLERIPHEVERAIANQEFKVSEGASTDYPAVIGRVIPCPGGDWSVIAVVIKGCDDRGRGASLYRYFLTQADEGLARILAWLDSEQKRNQPISIDPFPRAPKKIGQPNKSTVPMITPRQLDSDSLHHSTPFIIQYGYSCFPNDVHEFAKFKAYRNGQPLAWAFNVEALKHPGRFQVIYPASALATQRIHQALAASPVVSTSTIDEQAIKSSIKSLINSSQVKPEWIQTLANSLSTVETELESFQAVENFWQNAFDKQGASNAFKQNIYSVQAVRLLTLRAILLPNTVVDYLSWLQGDGSEKEIERFETSVAFQSQLSSSPELTSTLELNLLLGISNVLEDVFHQKLPGELAIWLLNSKNGVWEKALPRILEIIRLDLLQISGSMMVETNRLPDFYRNSQTWDQIRWKFQHPSSSKDSSDARYVTLANLFFELRQYAIAACFYQAGKNSVPDGLYKIIRQTGQLKGNRYKGKIFGILVIKEITLEDIVFSFITSPPFKYFSSPVPPVILLIIVTFLFIGKFYTSQIFSQRTPQYAVSPVKTSIDPAILNKAIQESMFKNTQQSLNKILNDLSKDPVIQAVPGSRSKEQIIEAIKSELLDQPVWIEYQTNSLRNEGVFEDISKLNTQQANTQYLNTQQEKDIRRDWSKAIYLYQKRKELEGVELAKAGYMSPDGPTCKSLRSDVKKRLLSNLPTDQIPILPSAESPANVWPSPPADMRN